MNDHLPESDGPQQFKRLTRRTRRFRELAEGIETRVEARGHRVNPGAVDEILNQKNATVAALMGVEPRQELWYALDEVMDEVAAAICEALEADERHGSSVSVDSPALEPKADAQAVDSRAGNDRPRVRFVASELAARDEYDRAAVTGVRARRREAQLTQQFEEFLTSVGHEFGRLRIAVPGESADLVTDTFDMTAQVLYEAKAGIDRMTIRLGVGQLLDYLRYLPDAQGALLLPGNPSQDLEAFIASCGLALVWPDSGSWRSFGVQRR